MSTRMTKDEREAFLAGVHVGVLTVAEPGRGPLAAPVWYAYEPGGDVLVVTDDDSRKAVLLRAAGRATLVAQDERAPYKYVTVEGPVRFETADVERDLRPIARRYLGEQLGDQYVAGAGSDGGVLVRLAPERWNTVDYSKQFG